MPWESIGSVDTGSMPEDRSWIAFCQGLAKRYITLVAGSPPDGHQLGVFEADHELGSYPNLGVYWDFDLDDRYVSRCEQALDVFNDAVDWSVLKEHWEASQEEEDDEEDEDEY
jgi:hypothetical protein